MNVSPYTVLLLFAGNPTEFYFFDFQKSRSVGFFRTDVHGDAVGFAMLALFNGVDRIVSVEKCEFSPGAADAVEGGILNIKIVADNPEGRSRP